MMRGKAYDYCIECYMGYYLHNDISDFCFRQGFEI